MGANPLCYYEIRILVVTLLAMNVTILEEMCLVLLELLDHLRVGNIALVAAKRCISAWKSYISHIFRMHQCH